MAAYEYWGAQYWGANYWVPEYWATLTGTDSTGEIATTLDGVPDFISGGEAELWSNTYWGANYWGANYWGGGTRGSAFIGTFAPAGQVNGTIGPTLEPYPTLFSGPAVQAHIFDVSVTVAVPWIIQEFGFTDGSINLTAATSPESDLDDHTAAFVGQFVQSTGFIGNIAATLGDDSANFDGSHVGPGSFSGNIATTLGGTVNAITGQFFDPGTSIGSISVTLDPSDSNLIGVLSPGSKTGTISVTLDDYAADIPGFFSQVAIFDGTLGPTLQDATSAITGTNEANVQAITPAARTNVIEFDDRTCVVEFEDRTNVIPGE